MSFIPKNSNKTQDKSISRWKNPEGHLRTRWDRDRSDLDRDRDDRSRSRSARSRSARSRSQSRRSRSRARSRSRSREAAIDASREIGEIAIAISLISMIAIARSVDREIAIDADRRDRDRDRRRSAQFRSRRDRDRGASVWVVPAQWSVWELVRVRAESFSVCESFSVWESSGNQLKWKKRLNPISVVFCLFSGQTEIVFSLTEFYSAAKCAIFRKLISENQFQSKQTEPKCSRAYCGIS